jgi:hypothetical protein
MPSRKRPGIPHCPVPHGLVLTHISVRPLPPCVAETHVFSLATTSTYERSAQATQGGPGHFRSDGEMWVKTRPYGPRLTLAMRIPIESPSRKQQGEFSFSITVAHGRVAQTIDRPAARLGRGRSIDRAGFHRRRDDRGAASPAGAKQLALDHGGAHHRRC